MPGRRRRRLPLAGLVIAMLLVGGSHVAPAAAPSVPHATRYAVFEQALGFAASATSVDVRLRAPSGKTASIGGFYAGQSGWKFRFAPSELGTWTWTARASDGPPPVAARGSFVVAQGTSPGFVRHSPYNPFRWTFTNGEPYYPIGLQDCTVPLLSPDPLRYWGLDGGFTGGDYVLLGRWVGMDAYLRTYAAAGFDLFRWGPENCAFSLVKRIDPAGNVYSVAGGHYADLLFSALRDNGFRIEMVLFNEPAFADADGDPAKMAAVERYVKYVVDRYGAYVDFWELMNESSASDGWYAQIAGYLRRIDPYRHPIATSWSKPELAALDYDSDHWYQTEPELDSDRVAWARLRSEQARQFGKPTIVDEQGNAGQNWDPGSAVRMRLRAWTTFFAESSLVFWNTSVEKDYLRPDSAANIYLGPVERRYVRVLQDYTSGFDARARVVDASVPGRPDIRAYALRGPKDYGLYLVAGASHSLVNSGVQVLVDPQAPGLAMWIDPASGRVLATAKVAAGTHALRVPAFTTDVAVKIAAQ